jgi:hypothetical protein
MKKILLFFTIFIPLMIAAETVVPPGPVSGHWKLDVSPYVITGDIFIEEGETLTIYPGVELYFKGAYKLEVFGALEANGLESSKIRFTTYEGVDIWNGIRFLESTSNSIIDHCIIEMAFADLDPQNFPENGGGGIFCFNSPEAEIIISNTLIQDCRAVYGGGIMSYNSNVIIESCELYNNMAFSGGGVLLYENLQTVIQNCKIFNNQATSDGGGITLLNTTKVSMQRTQIAYNNAVRGGGMFIELSDGDFCGNTIAKNSADDDGGGIYFITAASPRITNTVIYTNTDGTKGGGNQVFLAYNNCDPDFYHCNIYGGLEGFEGPGAPYYNGQYEHCVDGDPMFVDADEGNFDISWENYPYDDDTKSACIDNGCPEQGLDPDKSCCDIGVFSYYQILEVPTGLESEPLIDGFTFIASWDESYGALGYYLDASYNAEFSHFIIEGKPVRDRTVDTVEIPYFAYHVYYRLTSFNTGLTSEYSDVHMVTMTSVEEAEEEHLKIYSSATGIHINTTPSYTYPGDVWIYNISGQLLGHYSMNPGSNTIDPGLTSQVVIVKVILDGEVYQQKLLMR